MTQEKKPLVTIITITFNLIKSGREKTFRQCLESVHNQDYDNIEHVIIDGASKDGTIDLIKEYADKGWIKYISEPDRGIYDAMNKGIGMANGKYIAFLNSDDYYHDSQGVESVVKALEDSDADYLYADTRSIDNRNDNPVGVWAGNINLIPFGIHYCHQSMFVKLAVIRELGGFDTRYRVSADSDLMIKIYAIGKRHVYLPRCIVSYRSGGLSVQNSLQCRRDHSDAFYKHIGYKNGMSREDCYDIWNFSAFSEKNLQDCLNLACKLNKPEWMREFILRFAKEGGSFALEKKYSKKDEFNKFLSLMIQGKLRQPIRRIYYAIRLKKIK